MSYIRAVNTLLKDDSEAIRYNLNLTGFSIVPVGAAGMIIEWVDGYKSLKEKAVEAGSADGLRIDFTDIRQVLPDKHIRDCIGD